MAKSIQFPWGFWAVIPTLALSVLLFALGCSGSSGGSSQIVAPAITTQPAGVSVNEGQGATFTVIATGTGPMSYQWYRASIAINGATSATYSIAAVSRSDNDTPFTVKISNAAGSIISSPAILSVLTPSTLSLTASKTAIQPGESVTLTCTFPGSATDSSGYPLYWIDLGGMKEIYSGQTFQVTPTTTTTYQLLYTYYNNRGSIQEPMRSVTVEVAGSPTPAFTTGGGLLSARTGAGLSRMADGTVLLTGGHAVNVGNGALADLASAECYDPAINAFRAVPGSMAEARSWHTSTLLGNGKVLLTGGIRSTTSLGSAELFDPGSETFTPIPGGMVVARAHHRATLLADGRVLLTGGVISGAPLNGAEIYDPASNTFTSVPSPMQTSRYAHAATLLPDGKVLICGGMTNTSGPNAYEVLDPMSDRDGTGFALVTGEIFDPAAMTFTPIANTMRTPRAYFTATLLPSGKVVLWGAPSIQYGPAPGGTNATLGLEIFDSALHVFDNLGGGQGINGFVCASAVLLPDGRMLLEGGESPNAIFYKYNAITSAYIEHSRSAAGVISVRPARST